MTENHSKEIGFPMKTSIVLEINGRSPRLGKMAHNKIVQLKARRRFILTADRRIARIGTKRAAYCNCKAYLGYCQPGDKIKIGIRLVLVVVEVVKISIVCRVKKSGPIESYQELLVYGGSYNNVITTDEVEDIQFAITNDIKAVILPTPGSQEYFQSIREYLDEHNGKQIQLFTRSNTNNLHKQSDAQFISFSYSGIFHQYLNHSSSVNDGPIELNLCEKLLFELCYKQLKPIILVVPSKHKNIELPNVFHKDSKYLHFYPDGFLVQTTDGEPSIFRFKHLLNINLPKSIEFARAELNSNKRIDHEIIETVAIASYQLNAAAIFVHTKSGRTAIHLSNYRTNSLIIALTNNERTASKLLLYKNIRVIVCLKENIAPIALKAWKLNQYQLLHYGVMFLIKLDYIRNDSVVIFFYHSKPCVNYCDEFRSCVVKDFLGAPEN